MAFTINGVSVREPAREGVTITEEPVWAPNTGRALNGKMVGDLVGWKRTFSVTWPPLTFEQTGAIITAIKNAGAFFPITFTNTSGGSSVESATVYTSNIPRTVSSLSNAYKRNVGVTVTFIEQ